MKQVCIQGLGFVGAAMAVAVASARTSAGKARYQVVGVDQDTAEGRRRVEALNRGDFPFPTTDACLQAELQRAIHQKNLLATKEEHVYETADVVVIDIAQDIEFDQEQPEFDLTNLERAFISVARRVPSDSLILVETTVPPGTCERVLTQLLNKELMNRGLMENAVHLAHSFERVMPGDKYLNSITNFWRVYAGATEEAADICEGFLNTFIDVDRFPLTRLDSMTASETTKVMENTYRAVNIAFIDEWTKYAEAIGVDLYEILDAIRVRPTHSNIRFPGIGVGGYCLTKDPAFAPASVRQFFNNPSLKFPFSDLARKINNEMPSHSAERLIDLLGGSVSNKRILVLGVSYRPNVGDTRYSPIAALVDSLEKKNARVTAYDPLVEYWQERQMPVHQSLPSADLFDAVIFAVPHEEILKLDLYAWLAGAKPAILDAANCLSRAKRQKCRRAGVRVESVGRGEGL